MSSDSYLQTILHREAVDVGPYSSVRNVQAVVEPFIRRWAGNRLKKVSPSGSFAKGTAIRSGTDIDLFISLSHETQETLKDIYDSLLNAMRNTDFSPKRQNVSINVRINGCDVDLVPARQQDAWSDDHSLYRSKVNRWIKTNVAKHIGHVIKHGRLQESRIIKLWRNQNHIDFPSFYLEMTVIEALSREPGGSLSDNVWKVFHYLRDRFSNARVIDPANTNNIISEDLTDVEKSKITTAARQTLKATNWNQIVT